MDLPLSLYFPNNLVIQQVFIKYLLCSKDWGKDGKSERHTHCTHEADDLEDAVNKAWKVEAQNAMEMIWRPRVWRPRERDHLDFILKL